MEYNLGDWLSASFVGGEERDDRKFKVLYWDEYVRYIAEPDYTPFNGYWYGRTYFKVYSKPALGITQETWL